jgi:hypothetical protein
MFTSRPTAAVGGAALVVGLVAAARARLGRTRNCRTDEHRLGSEPVRDVRGRRRRRQPGTMVPDSEVEP